MTTTTPIKARTTTTPTMIQERSVLPLASAKYEIET